ncbi:MAG: HlyD family secretion protein [Myxococcota bacterium]|jgi:HlyD family secretion protein
MRRWIAPLLVIGALLLFVGTVVFLYQRARVPEVVYLTEPPATADIVKKTVASGAIVPRDEVAVKPRVSGVIQSIAVVPGAIVKAGDLIAVIGVIPDSMSLNNATSSLRRAEISVADARRAHTRDRALAEQNVLSTVALQQSEVTLQLREQERQAAVDTLRLIREGAARGGSDVNTQVRATIGGMVLDVPVKVGQSVIESNTFNEGTTVGIIADMGDLIFQGTLDESEVGRVKEGMPLRITVGALEDERFEGTLEYISPKGVVDQGAVQFEIRAAVRPPEGRFIRAGVSATADIVLDTRTGVLAIKESLLQFDKEGPFVEVEVAPQVFEVRRVEVGLSDGIHIEVLGGVVAGDAIKGREG